MRGSGVTRPAACRMRRMVEVEGGRWPSRSRCQAIVTGPASRPRLVSCRRRSTIRSRTAVAVAAGVRSWSPGAGVDGVEAAVAVAGEQAVEVPAAVAVLGRGGGDGQLPVMTFRTATRAFDMAGACDCNPCRDSLATLSGVDLCREPRHPILRQPKQDAPRRRSPDRVRGHRWSRSAQRLVVEQRAKRADRRDQAP